MPRAILCIAPGGHRAIEIVGETGFCPASAELELLSPRADDPECPGACVDAPIGASFVGSKTAQHHDAALPWFTTTPLAPPFSLESDGRAVVAASPRVARHPYGLRTVIIRC